MGALGCACSPSGVEFSPQGRRRFAMVWEQRVMEKLFFLWRKENVFKWWGYLEGGEWETWVSKKLTSKLCGKGKGGAKAIKLLLMRVSGCYMYLHRASKPMIECVVVWLVVLGAVLHQG